MAVQHLATRGYGNGTLAGTIALVTLRGYGAGVIPAPAPERYPKAVIEAGSIADAIGEREREIARQREYNRRERAAREYAERQAAEALAESKQAAKRRAKRAFREIERAPGVPTDELVASMLQFAPRLADVLELPPLEAVKFDELVRDAEALVVLFQSLEMARIVRREDEAAALMLILAEA